MKLGKLALGAIVAFVIMFLTDWLWYTMIMKDKMTHWSGERPEPLMMWLILGVLIYCVAFVYIFSKGVGSGAPVGEGARYGFWVTLLAWLPMGFVWYSLNSTSPLPEYLIDSVYRLVQAVVMGIAVAYLAGMQGDRGKTATGGDD